MNKKHLHIVISCFLIANVLLGQVVINLLHDRHDFHETVVKTQTSLVEHGDHCKICSLDLLFNLLITPPTHLNSPQPEILPSAIVNAGVTLSFFSITRDRAPPFFS